MSRTKTLDFSERRFSMQEERMIKWDGGLGVGE